MRNYCSRDMRDDARLHRPSTILFVRIPASSWFFAPSVSPFGKVMVAGVDTFVVRQRRWFGGGRQIDDRDSIARSVYCNQDVVHSVADKRVIVRGEWQRKRDARSEVAEFTVKDFNAIYRRLKKQPAIGAELSAITINNIENLPLIQRIVR